MSFPKYLALLNSIKAYWRFFPLNYESLFIPTNWLRLWQCWGGGGGGALAALVAVG